MGLTSTNTDKQIYFSTKVSPPKERRRAKWHQIKSIKKAPDRTKYNPSFIHSSLLEKLESSGGNKEKKLNASLVKLILNVFLQALTQTKKLLLRQSIPCRGKKVTQNDTISAQSKMH